MNVFNPQEILKIAINVEENGEKLYSKLWRKTKKEKLKKIWQHLKEQEENHKKTFEKILKNIGDYIVFELEPGQYDTYLRAIASNYIITKELIKEKTKILFKSDLEAIDFGIFIEKESILTYTEFKKYMLLEKQGILEKVIDEERKHLVDLVLLKEEIKKG